MIFEDEHSVLQDNHNLSFAKNIIHFHGDKSFILNSLHKIKNNTLCKIKRKTINKLIKDYTRHLNYIENEDINLRPENYELSPIYARQSYNKVLKEDEYLQKLLVFLMNQ
ncbi:hypothetical protein SAMN05421846_111161 [Chryseobacterium taeanense]|uniref:Uncharacterized protein n=1 Tax=Chryseobacterium taeanense TaxID=311334 RepID=A0A1G8MJR7_9FLAO|nr:hypothetical protein [Chryseobacterium taeanense]SDI68094.1 hypothetical protein SAMN05421846_111161 [Chryseobacterium taeanense]